MTELLTSDSILYGAFGFGAGYFIGFLVKKTMKILFKLTLVLLAVFVTALFYLQNIKVIAINEKAFDNLLNEGYNQLNQTIGNQINNPFQYIASTLGVPLSGGLFLGMSVGWLRS